MEAHSAKITREMKIVLIACCLGVFMMPLMSTMMNLALPSLETEFGIGAKAQALVNASFLLASVTVMVPVARLSDIVGRKKIFIAGLIATLIGAVIGIFCPSFSILLISRLIMGAGSAALSVSAVAMITDVFPLERRGFGIGVQSTFVYLGIAIGPALGGFITFHFGWRTLFLFVIPIALLAFVAILNYKNERRMDTWKKMDYRGTLLYSVMITLTLFGMINLPSIWGILMIAAGLSVLLIFIMTMKKTESPVLEIGIFRHKVFTRACLAAYMNYGACYAVAFFFSLYLVNLGALTQPQAGLILLIQPLFQVCLTWFFGNLSDKVKDKRILPTAGMIMICIGISMVIFIEIELNVYFIGIILATLGIGYGMFAAPNTNAVMSSLPPRNRGEASGMIALFRQVGMSTSLAIAMCTISFIMGTTDNLSDPSTWGPFIEVIRTAFTIYLIMSIIGTFFAWFRGDKPKKSAPT